MDMALESSHMTHKMSAITRYRRQAALCRSQESEANVLLAYYTFLTLDPAKDHPSQLPPHSTTIIMTVHDTSADGISRHGTDPCIVTPLFRADNLRVRAPTILIQSVWDDADVPD
jgi:hypothetical protein